MHACTLLAVAALACAAPSARAQDPAPQPAPAAQTPAAPVLKPGELPADASPEARALWQKLALAARDGAANVAPPSGFDLTFDMRVYKERGSNDVDATRFRFDPHGWLRTSIQKSGRERLHGPSGSFLIDQGKATSLEGREHEQDRKEILETLAVSRNFLALADPRALRIASLVKMPAPPVELPAALAPAAAKLDWLAVESPDFHLVQTDKKKRDARYRVQIGLDPASGLPRMATVAEIENGAVSLASQPQLVELKTYEKLDGFQVPKEIVTYPAESQRAPWVFRDRPSAMLFVRPGGTLRPVFGERDFLPPQ